MYEVAHWFRKCRCAFKRRAAVVALQPIYNPKRPAPCRASCAGQHGRPGRRGGLCTQWHSRPWAARRRWLRARVLFRFLEIVQARKVQLAELLTSEHGKTLPDALGEVARGIENIEFATAMPQLLKGEYTEQIARGMDAWSMRQPWASSPASRLSISRPWCRCGCTRWRSAAATPSSCKPSERDPSPSLLMAQWLKEAGLPDGVFNVVQGDKAIVDCDPGAQGYRGGELRRLDDGCRAHLQRGHEARQARAGPGRREESHGGDARRRSSEQAADALMGAAYGSAGERCMAISVAVAVGEVGDALVAKLKPRVAALKIGEGHGEGVEMGPLITAQAKQRVELCLDRPGGRAGREGGRRWPWLQGGGLRGRLLRRRHPARWREHGDGGLSRGDLRPRFAAWCVCRM